MKILVTVKQVPDTSGKVAVNPDGTLDRASMQTIINPDDLNAVEAALALKDELGCKVIAFTMGPPPAESMLRELMAMGVDEGVLITAREFGGSDTYATSQIIAAAIDTYGVEADDIILAGRQAIDGDTAQVGPQIAEKLHLPQITYAGEIKKDGNTLTVKRMKTGFHAWGSRPTAQWSEAEQVPLGYARPLGTLAGREEFFRRTCRRKNDSNDSRLRTRTLRGF